MNKELLNYIRTLSMRDKKTLTQKALKATEEVGELARAVLPYEGAYATNHRFTQPEDILEECVDTMLCVLAIAYNLKFTDDQIEETIVKKAEKWAKLQANEDKAEFPLPFEIHITLAPGNLRNSIESFKIDCADAKVKPILLDLHNKTGEVILSDVMTSSKHFGDNRSVYYEAVRIQNHFVRAGYEIIRVKIETVPWHPAAPQSKEDIMPKGCYFESHIAVRLNEKIMLAFRARMKRFDIHLSKNALKVHEDESQTLMVTYRSYDKNRSQFENIVAQIHEELSFKYDYVPAEQTKVGKPITEFSIYDTKISYDYIWIPEANARKET